MKIFLVAALLAGTMFAVPAFAQDTTTSQSTSGSDATGVGVGIASTTVPVTISPHTTSSANSNSGALSNSLAVGGAGGNSTSAGGNSTSNATGGASGAANAANAQNTNLTVLSNTVIPRDTTSHFAPQVVASGLTTSNDTCMGSTSAGLSLIGGGGSLGTTWDDKACARRQNAVRLYAMGWRSEACEVMNQDASVQAAFAKTGRKCEDMTDNDLAGPTPAAVYSAPLPPQVPPPPSAPAQAVPQPAQPQPQAEPGGERGQNNSPWVDALVNNAGTMAPIPNP